jgi:hypothetical protein
MTAGNDAVSAEVSGGLRRLRRLRTVLGLIGVGSVLAVMLFGVFQTPEWLFNLSLGVWFLAWTTAGLSIALYKCPRCRSPFHRRGHYGNAFTSSCLSCGLSLRAKQVAAEQ